jgi:phospholipid/cholesterol/gamma-HCH transport system ATP-binding protein
MTPLIRVRGLRKAFGSLQVLSGVDTDFPEGKISAVVGQSGTGKSVLFKSIIGLLKPDAGQVWFRDLELTAAKTDELMDARRHIGYSFQNAALFDSMDVRENLEFPLREVLRIRDSAEMHRRVSQILDWIGLPGIETKHPSELSGGMRKRVGVARALMLEPEVLLFDEPTTGLDPVLAETINNLVVRVNQELGITCVLITHDIPAAFRISDKIAFLDRGIIIADGAPKDVSVNNHELVRDFLRTSFNQLEA